ncbi:MAG: NUDIX hydrolase [archaeon]
MPEKAATGGIQMGKQELIKNGPWTVVERAEKYANRFGLKVFEDKVIRPDGKEGVYGWVSLNPGVSVLPVDEKGNVYLGKDFQYAIGKISLEAISGGINPGETHLEAAKRELKEELGITSKEWIYLGQFNSSTAVVNSNQFLYMAKGLTFGEQELEAGENIKLVKISLEEAVNKVMDGTIFDGQTTSLILKVNHYIEKHC